MIASSILALVVFFPNIQDVVGGIQSGIGKSYLDLQAFLDDGEK